MVSRVPTNKFSNQTDDSIKFGGLDVNMVSNRFRDISKGYKWIIAIQSI